MGKKGEKSDRTGGVELKEKERRKRVGKEEGISGKVEE